MMNTVPEVMTALEKKGSEQTRKTMARHGAPDNMFGVKIAELKMIAKKIKGNQELALELYETGNYDAQYLAGLVADGADDDQAAARFLGQVGELRDDLRLHRRLGRRREFPCARSGDQVDEIQTGIDRMHGLEHLRGIRFHDGGRRSGPRRD